MALSSKEALAEFEVGEFKELERGQLESGSYATVLRAKVDGVTRIAKRLHRIFVAPEVHKEDKEGIRERFYKECLLLSKLDHPCIVQFIGVHFHGVDRINVDLIMECLHTDLGRFLDPKERPTIPLSIKLSILLDVSAGLLYLHHQLEEPLIHRDLKAENILLTNDIRAKIADLGVSKLLKNYPHQAAIQTKCPGTLAYMPPEALCEHPQYDTSLDIFSFGQLALYTANQQFPQVFCMDHDPKMTHAIRVGESEIFKRKKWIDMLGEGHCLRDIIIQCLKNDTTSRPKTQELKNKIKTLCVVNPVSLVDVHSLMENKVALNDKKFEGRESNIAGEHSKMFESDAVNLEISQLKSELIRQKKLLQDKEDELRRTTEKHKTILCDIETSHLNQVKRFGAEIQDLTSQVCQAQSKKQTELMQENQYLEENQMLKMQLGDAIRSLQVMAEEMVKDRRRAFELQNKMKKSHKSMKHYFTRKNLPLPDPYEANEQKIAQLEDLYNAARKDALSLTVEKEQLTRQVEKLLSEKQLCPHQKSTSTMESSTSEQPSVVKKSMATDPLGQSGASNLSRETPSTLLNRQLPLRAHAPEGPPDGDPFKQCSQPYPNPSRINSRSPEQVLIEKGEKLTPCTHPLNRQLPLRAHAPEGPPNGDPFKQRSQPNPNLSCMNSRPPEQVLIEKGEKQPCSPQPSSDCRLKGDPSSHLAQPSYFRGELKSRENPSELSGEQSLFFKHVSEYHLELQKHRLAQSSSNSPGVWIPSDSRENYSEEGEKLSSSLERDFSPKFPCKVLPTCKTTSDFSECDISNTENPQPTLSMSHRCDVPLQTLTKALPDGMTQYDTQSPGSLFNSPLRGTHPQENCKAMSPPALKSVWDSEGKQKLSESTAESFERSLDEEIHQCATKIIQEVSGKGFEESVGESGRPFDPNLICPTCKKKFRIGEIQCFRRHVIMSSCL